jgi:hypothetical protein
MTARDADDAAVAAVVGRDPGNAFPVWNQEGDRKLHQALDTERDQYHRQCS